MVTESVSEENECENSAALWANDKKVNYGSTIMQGPIVISGCVSLFSPLTPVDGSLQFGWTADEWVAQNRFMW